MKQAASKRICKKSEKKIRTKINSMSVIPNGRGRIVCIGRIDDSPYCAENANQKITHSHVSNSEMEYAVHLIGLQIVYALYAL